MDFYSRDLPDFIPLRPPMPSSSWSSQLSPTMSSPHTEPPIDHVRKITPPEEHEIHTDEKLAVAEEHRSPYEQAERYVEEYRAWMKPGSSQYQSRPLEDYETSLCIKMSTGDWIKLRQKLYEESNDQYPRLSYNAATSTLIIECNPNPIHQSITAIIAEEFDQSKSTCNDPTEPEDKSGP